MNVSVSVSAKICRFTNIGLSNDMQAYIDYKGERFHLQSSKRYYQSGDKNQPIRSLHRRIWTEFFGAIPDGYEIHHKNGDWTDNDPSNLDCLPSTVHQRQHMLERFQDEAYRDANKLNLAKAQEAAKEWHASEEGLAWHSKNGLETWQNRMPVKATCSVCSKEYETYFASRSRFCSHACEQKEGYQRRKTATGTCLVCGSEFSYNKYREGQECCSRACSNKLRGARQRGVELPKAAPTNAGY